MEGDLVDQLFNSSEKRLARLLLILANFGKEEDPETIIPKMSQETLAEMVGTTRSRISFFNPITIRASRSFARPPVCWSLSCPLRRWAF